MSKLRVMYILNHFPQISETYIQTEIEALSQECDIRIISLHQASSPRANSPSFCITDDPELIREAIEEFRPQVLHSHWLLQTRVLAYFAGYFSNESGHSCIPFTIRAHSFDVLDYGGKYIRESAPFINSDLCLGVLAFPFTRALLEKGGIRGDKVYDCYPVVNYERFYDTSPNGESVMNVGACLPKKKMGDFLELASAVPHAEFNLYPLGYESPEIRRLNTRMNNPVNIIPPVQPENMLREYKKHRWLVYTACPRMNTVGWPIAVAEAQAAGVGVCFPNIRPDVKEYVGEAGFLFDSTGEARDIISRPFPDEMRQKGFTHARRSDIADHKSTLVSLWRNATSSRSDGFNFVRSADETVLNWEQGETAVEQGLRLRRALREFEEVIPSGSTVILIDDSGKWIADKAGSELRAITFLQRDAEYSGPPSNDNAAIGEVEELRRSGAHFLVFAWPAFWRLDYYTGLREYLRSNFKCVLGNDRLTIFDLRC